MDRVGSKHFDSGTCDSIPIVVNDVPADTTFTIMNYLKNISCSIEEIRERQYSSEYLQEQINILMETVYHLVKQNNKLQDTATGLQKSLKAIRKDLQGSNDKKSRHKPINSDSVRDSMKSTKIPDLQKLIHLEEALQENFTAFVENLSFKDTSIPDKLLELECLSEDECSVIRSKNDKDQVRHLLLKMMHRGPKKIYSFLKILEKQDYGYLSESVFESLKNIEHIKGKEDVKCIVCYMKRNVDLRDIGDVLLQTKVINKEIYGMILEPSALHANKYFLWSTIINNVNKGKNFDEALNHLQKSLKGKYDFLTSHLQNVTSDLQCSCGRFRRRRRQGFVPDFGSQSDLSSASNIPKFSDLQSDDSTEPESSSTYSSMEIGTTFASLQQYRRISDGPCDSTSQEQIVSESSKQDVTRQESSTFDVGQDSYSAYYNRQISVPYNDSTTIGERPRYDHSVSEISSATLCEDDQDIFVDAGNIKDDKENTIKPLPHEEAFPGNVEEMPSGDKNLDPDQSANTQIYVEAENERL